MPIKVDNVEIHMGPNDIGAPDDLKSAIISFISGTKKRLDIAVQELDSDEIAREIVKARLRGVSPDQNGSPVAQHPILSALTSIPERPKGRLMVCLLCMHI